MGSTSIIKGFHGVDESRRRARRDVDMLEKAGDVEAQQLAIRAKVEALMDERTDLRAQAEQIFAEDDEVDLEGLTKEEVAAAKKLAAEKLAAKQALAMEVGKLATLTKSLTMKILADLYGFAERPPRTAIANEQGRV